MVTAVKSLINLAQVGQALVLTGESLRVAKKKKKTLKDVTGLGVKSIVGISLIKTTGKLASGL